MITLKEQEIYRILQTKDPAIATLEGYGIKKKVKMFVEKNQHYQNIDFTINDYDKQIYSEATRSMVRGLLLNGYSQQDIYGINRQINKLAESFYRMPLHKILSENGVRQVRKLLEDDTSNPKSKWAFLNDMAQKVFEWAKNANIHNFGPEQIEKLKQYITPVDDDSAGKNLQRMVTGWIAIISAVVGAAFLAKWLIKLFLKAVKGGVNLLKKFFGIFSAKTKIPLENQENPNE
jgi:hypothetical protein